MNNFDKVCPTGNSFDCFKKPESILTFTTFGRYERREFFNWIRQSELSKRDIGYLVNEYRLNKSVEVCK